MARSSSSARCNPQELQAQLSPLLVEGESIYLSFKGVRDFVAFTNKRLIAVNVQGLTGKKRDYSSLALQQDSGLERRDSGHL